MSPLVRWACPENKPTFGETHEASHCITTCEDKCASPFMIAALTASNQRNHHRGKYISATSLSGCVRKLQLERTVDYADFMQNSFYGYRGTVMHQVVEDSALVDLGELGSLESLGYLSEWRMSIGFCMEHGGFRLPAGSDATQDDAWLDTACPDCEPNNPTQVLLLGGTLDGLEPIWDTFDPDEGTLDAILWDLKTMQEYAVRYFIQGDKKNVYHPNVKDGHYEQAQMYRYMAEICEPPQLLKDRGVKRLNLIEANIQVFAMNKFPRTGTHNSFKSGRSAEMDYFVPEITFESNEWVEEYIRERALPIYHSLVTGEKRGPITEPTGGNEHSWLCRFCAFYETEYCPDPTSEWKLLQENVVPDEAFIQVSQGV